MDYQCSAVHWQRPSSVGIVRRPSSVIRRPSISPSQGALHMCGIVGYVGLKQVSPILLDGLRRLEYRGYDSAGIAVRTEDGTIAICKSQGKLSSSPTNSMGMPRVAQSAW